MSLRSLKKLSNLMLMSGIATHFPKKITGVKWDNDDIIKGRVMLWLFMCVLMTIENQCSYMKHSKLTVNCQKEHKLWRRLYLVLE